MPPSQVFIFLLAGFAALFSPATAIRCEVARAKCAFRDGCGFSLRSYMLECSSLIAGHTNQCSERCERALVALVSTEEGADLVNCECDGNKFCLRSKERIEACRASVFSATREDAIVSCNTARWICMSDPVCSTALDYYQLYCRDLVHGRGCSHRCNNSLSILNRQEKAAKLRTCYCDGTEEFPCEKLKYNTEKYCYGRGGPKTTMTPFGVGIRLDDPRQRQRHHYGTEGVTNGEAERDYNSIAYGKYHHRYHARTHQRHRNRKYNSINSKYLGEGESSATQLRSRFLLTLSTLAAVLALRLLH